MVCEVALLAGKNKVLQFGFGWQIWVVWKGSKVQFVQIQTWIQSISGDKKLELIMNDVVFFSSDSYKGEERLRLNLWKLLII